MGIEGKVIKKVRNMTQAELDAEGWTRPTICLELEDGTVIYPSQDEEGNGPGEFFGTNGDESFMLMLR